MSVSTFDDEAIEQTRWLEMRERVRHGVSAIIARKSIARRLGVAPGTLENISRGRAKRGVSAWLGDRIREAFVHELDKEIRRLVAARDMALARGAEPSSHEVIEACAAIEQARELIEGRT